MTGACRADGDSTLVRVRVSPRAKRDEISGVHGQAVKVRLTAPPVEGKANAALLALLARRLDVRPRALELVAGTAARNKTVRVTGRSVGQVARRLQPP